MNFLKQVSENHQAWLDRHNVEKAFNGTFYFETLKEKKMKITVISTTKITHLNGVPARIWEGMTDTGIKVHCYITRIAIDKNEPRIEEFEKELLKQSAPSLEVEAIPRRMIL